MEKKKNFVIGALLAAIVLMSVSYAVLAQTLTINGTANITASWDVGITGIAPGTLTGATNKSATFDSASATFAVDLEYPGATATYNITIENGGNLNAVLKSISGVDTANSAEPSAIQYTVTGVTVNSTLAADATATAVVTATWVADPSGKDTIPATTTKTATITFNYEQATS